MKGANGGNNYKKYEAQKRASGKLVLKDPKAEAIVVFLAEGYSQSEIPQLLATYLDIQTDEAEIATILAKPDVKKRLEVKRREFEEGEWDRKQPTSEKEYQEYALKKLWAWARKEEPRFSVRACEALLKALKQGQAPEPEEEDQGDPLAERLGEIMKGDGDGGEGDE